MNKKVIYTSITGGYDNLLQPLAVDPSFDYICFCDDFVEDCIGVWQIRPLAFSEKGPVVRSRWPKILPHKALSEYEYSLWIDANVQILDGSVYSVIDELIQKDVVLGNVPHPKRDCVYDELFYCYWWYKVRFVDVLRIHKSLKKKAFPRHYGLYENNLILRKHNDPGIVGLDEAWWVEFLKNPQRDQLTYMPTLRQRGINPVLIFGEGKHTRNMDSFQCPPHLVSDKEQSLFRRMFHRMGMILCEKFLMDGTWEDLI